MRKRPWRRGWTGSSPRRQGPGTCGPDQPLALVSEIRPLFDGAIALSGAMSTSAHIAAARAMGADLAYLGTRFLTTREAMVSLAQKEMTVAARAADILYTPAISGVGANFLAQSVVAAGMDPANLQSRGELDMDNEAKVWRDVWPAGHGVSSLDVIPAAAELCDRLALQYSEAMTRLARDPFVGR